MSRAGTWRVFEKRYEPIEDKDGTLLRDWSDPDVTKAFDDKRFKYVWTVVEGDTGKLYAVPGFHTVNYLGRILCAKPWPDSEEAGPGYLY